MKDNMINSKLDIDDSKTLNDSHTVRINVVIDYFIEKDILINGEIKPKDDIEENNQKIGKNKNSKASSGKSTANKSNKSKKDTKTNGKKKKGKKKKEDDNSSYYFSYTIAGKIEGESDIIQYSNSVYQTFHDVDINLDFLKNLYNKQVEIKIWKLIPNDDERNASNDYLYRQIRTRNIMSACRKSNYPQSNKKTFHKPFNNLNSNTNHHNKENKNDEKNNNELEDEYSSNQSSLINYNFSLIPIKPVYDSLQQLNFPFKSSFQIPIRTKYPFMNYESMNQQHNPINNNDIFGPNIFSNLSGDYFDEFNNTLHIRPHPHHFAIPEKATRKFRSYSKSQSRSQSPTRKNNSKERKENNHSKTKKKRYSTDESDESNDEDYSTDESRGKSKSKKGYRKNSKSNRTRSSSAKSSRISDKHIHKNKLKKKGKGDNLSKKKNEDQYELIGKTTLDICKLFFDECEVRKNIDYPLGEIKHFGFKLTLSEPLLSIKQRRCLNPIAVEIVSAKSMPPKPSTNQINYAMVAPTYCKFSYLDSEKEYKCLEEHRQENNKIIFNSVHLLLTGHIKEEELFNSLLYKKLNIEIHDRDYEVPKEKKYISNRFDYVESYRTTYMPNIVYGVASFSLAPLVTGIKELTLISPVKTNFHLKYKGSDFVDNINYLEYGTSLKIKISVTYPIVKNIISNLNEITNFDFSRIIIIADKSENQNISKLIRIITEFNIKEFFRYEFEKKKKSLSNEANKQKNKVDFDKSKTIINKKILKINKNDDKEWSSNSICNSISNCDNISINSINDKNKLCNDNPMDFIENYDIEAFRIDKELLNDSELGVITGFHIFDQEHHMIFLEGPKKILQNIRDILNSNEFIKFKTFHSPKLTFYKRIWSSIYISPIYVYLRDSIKSLLTMNSTYLKCHTPKIALETLKLLEMIDECNSMEEINSKVLFPSYEQLSSLIGTLGNNVTTYEILLQLNTHQEQNITSYYTPNIEEESVEISQKKGINNFKRIDNINYLYLDLIKKRINREPNFIKQNIDKFPNESYPKGERVYGNEGIPYNYSIQYLNSTELRKKILQEEYSKYIKVLIHSYNKKYNSQNFEIYNSDK